MRETGIIIQVRTGSTRLPNKMLLPFCKRNTLLDFILERFENANFNKKIIVEWK